MLFRSSMGMTPACILTYRFAFSTVILLTMLLIQRKQIAIPLYQVPRLIMLSVFYCVSGGLLVVGYKYMSGGVTGVIHFTYPVFVMMILVTFFRERIRISSIIAIIFAIVGIYCLGVLGGGESFIPGQNKIAGILIVLASGVGCAGYIVGVNKTKCRELPSLTLTFWLLLFSMIIFGAIALYDNALVSIPSPKIFIDFISLALISTVLSNFLLVYAIKNIGSTYASILGAVETVTAVVSCAIIFSEPLTPPIIVGIILIFVSVGIVIMRKKD